jgi:ABC-type nitrate/sulfonate/bicarbonate transport system substrate-binding protein
MVHRLGVLVVCMGLAITACGGSDSGSPATDSADKEISVAFSSAVPQIEKVPTLQALETFKAQGYSIKTTWLQSSEDPVQAVARGDAVFGSASTTAVFTAIAKGVPVVAVTSVLNPAYAIVARKDIAGPADMDGKRLAINAQVSSTTLYANLMTEGLPNVKPKLLVIPGTPARVSAMMAGQADAAVVQLSAVPLLEKKAPGEFHVIYNVGDQQQGQSDSVLFVKKDTLEANRQLVQKVVDGVIKQQAAAYTDTQALADAIAKDVPDMQDAATAKQMAEFYVKSHAWPADGSFAPADLQTTIDRLQNADLLTATLAADQCCDTSLAGT